MNRYLRKIKGKEKDFKKSVLNGKLQFRPEISKTIKINPFANDLYLFISKEKKYKYLDTDYNSYKKVKQEYPNYTIEKHWNDNGELVFAIVYWEYNFIKDYYYYSFSSISFTEIEHFVEKESYPFEEIERYFNCNHWTKFQNIYIPKKNSTKYTKIYDKYSKHSKWWNKKWLNCRSRYRIRQTLKNKYTIDSELEKIPINKKQKDSLDKWVLIW